MTTEFGPATTVKVRDLRVGDFIEYVPQQGRQRGTRFESTLERMSAGPKRGFTYLFTMRTGASLGYGYPPEFDVVIRREQV
jgi:hypothetical protein